MSVESLLARSQDQELVAACKAIFDCIHVDVSRLLANSNATDWRSNWTVDLEDENDLDSETVVKCIVSAKLASLDMRAYSIVVYPPEALLTPDPKLRALAAEGLAESLRQRFKDEPAK